MKERLPYEESIKEQLNSLPIPDEDQSWQKMELLLDKDDDRRRIIPPIFTGCLGWGLLLLIGLFAFWFFVHPEKWFASKQEAINKSSTSDTTSQVQKEVPVKTDETMNPAAVPGGSPAEEKLYKNPGDSNDVVKDKSTGNTRTKMEPRKDKPIVSTASKQKKLSGSVKQRQKKDIGTKKTSTSNTALRNRNENKPVIERKQGEYPGNDLPDSIRVKRTSVKRPDTAIAFETRSIINTDTSVVIKKVERDSVRQNSPADSANKKDSIQKKIPEKKKFYFSAGIGLQQQIPVAGQKSNPYNIYGRKGSLGDYIPFLYVRLHRQEKWFIDGGFRYGAPQSVKEVSYNTNSSIQIDSLQGQVTVTTTTSTSSLKKTFYHQVPFSFNYMIRPNLSLGAGLVYSRFYGAVSEEEVRIKRNQVDSLASKKIVQVPSNTDSFFTKSQIQLILQTEYHWKRFGLGLRYTKGLQPFLRYISSNGQQKEERNQSLQVYLRFRIWKGKQ
jgi:hypothetical protein